jgi:hypothetical protein
MARASQKNQPTLEEAAPVLGSEHRLRVSEQLARLQQRQTELVEQTTRELEELRIQLEDGREVEEQVNRARQPLLTEIATLRTAIAQLENERAELSGELNRTQAEYQTHYTQMQGALNSLRNVVRSQARAFDQQVRVFSLDATQTIESMLGNLDAASVPIPERRAAAPVSLERELLPIEPAVAEAPFSDTPTWLEEPSVPIAATPQKPEKVRRERTPRSYVGLTRWAVRGFAMAAVGGIAFVGIQQLQGRADTGTVAGVTSAAPSPTVTTENPAEKYKESFALLPFDQTTWETYTDQDLGFSVRYPTNTSNKVRTIGGSNAWFLRFNGYLMKLTAETTQDTLDAWWEKSQGFYSDGATVKKGVFRGRPAWIVDPAEESITSGTTYIVGTKTGVLHVWVKDEDPKTDDGQRLTKMVDSLTFTN